MRKETPIYTKKYIEDTFAKKKYLHDIFVTKKYLDENVPTKTYLSKNIRELRSMLHESLAVTMENMKLYHKEETERYLGALLEGVREETAAIKENMNILNEKFYNHEKRIMILEAATTL